MIFNFFKSKPTLKELIPERFVDIHSHVLPGIDDGAKNIQESLTLISEMKKMGFTKIITTPHIHPGLYDNNYDTIEESFRLIKNKTTNLNFGAEYMFDRSLIETAQKGKLICLKDNYFLIEMGFISEPINLFDLIFEIIMSGYIPIIAHPERYLYLKGSGLKKAEKLKKMGCLFQINLLSAVNHYGKEVTKFCDKLLESDYIDFVGSDIHNKIHLDKFKEKIRLKNLAKLEYCIESNNLFD